MNELSKICFFDICKKKETYGLIKSEFELNPTTSQFARLTIHHISWNIQASKSILNDSYLILKGVLFFYDIDYLDVITGRTLR